MVKKGYLRTSAIFALSVLFTWTPSSINRVHSLLHPDSVNVGLTFASAFVLPLQGVWNAVIYFSTTWRPLCEELHAIRDKRFGPRRLPIVRTAAAAARRVTSIPTAARRNPTASPDTVRTTTTGRHSNVTSARSSLDDIDIEIWPERLARTKQTSRLSGYGAADIGALGQIRAMRGVFPRYKEDKNIDRSIP